MSDDSATRDPNAAITNAIAALPKRDRALGEALAMAIIDRVQAITGATQLRTDDHLSGLRGQMAQVLGNQPLIVDHLERQSARDERMLAALIDFQSGLERLGEDMTGLRQAFEERFLAIEGQQARADRRLKALEQIVTDRPEQRKIEQQAFRERQDELRQSQDELRQNQEAMAAALVRIEAALGSPFTVEEKAALRALLAGDGR